MATAEVFVVTETRGPFFYIAWQAMIKTYYSMFPLGLTDLFPQKYKK